MATTEVTVATPDGHRIPLYCWRADGAPRAVLLIAHGMAEHGARYAPLGAFLAGRGITSYAVDHRGHGQAALREEDVGHFADTNGWATVLADLGYAFDHIRTAHPGLPVILLGHSMGSFIAQGWAQTRSGELQALALSGSNSGSPLQYRMAGLLARLEKFRQGARGKSALLEFLSFGAFNKLFEPARTAYDWLSRDPVEVDQYIADPRCGFRVSNQLWIDLLGGLVRITGADKLAAINSALPVYLFGGDRDPVGQFGKGLPVLAANLRAAGIRDVQLKLYADGRHEMLNESNRAEVLADFANWLDSVLAAR